jgi:hypothetical protein
MLLADHDVRPIAPQRTNFQINSETCACVAELHRRSKMRVTRIEEYSCAIDYRWLIGGAICIREQESRVIES